MSNKKLNNFNKKKILGKQKNSKKNIAPKSTENTPNILGGDISIENNLDSSNMTDEEFLSDKTADLSLYSDDKGASYMEIDFSKNFDENYGVGKTLYWHYVLKNVDADDDVKNQEEFPINFAVWAESELDSDNFKDYLDSVNEQYLSVATFDHEPTEKELEDFLTQAVNNIASPKKAQETPSVKKRGGRNEPIFLTF